MSTTLGKKISELRKEKGITQEELAERLGVSPQAVSKWENDLSCPDIMLLPELAKLFDVAIDELFSVTPKRETELLPPEKRKNPEDMILYIRVDSKEGDRIRINLPIPLVKLAISMGIKLPQVSGNDILKNIDFEQILELVEKGLIGKLVEVETQTAIPWKLRYNDSRFKRGGYRHENSCKNVRKEHSPALSLFPCDERSHGAHRSTLHPKAGRHFPRARRTRASSPVPRNPEAKEKASGLVPCGNHGCQAHICKSQIIKKNGFYRKNRFDTRLRQALQVPRAILISG